MLQLASLIAKCPRITALRFSIVTVAIVADLRSFKHLKDVVYECDDFEGVRCSKLVELKPKKKMFALTICGHYY